MIVAVHAVSPNTLVSTKRLSNNSWTRHGTELFLVRRRRMGAGAKAKEARAGSRP
jgi:hypothetical protein